MQDKIEARRALLEMARERGWVTLDDIMNLASGSPVDLEEATDLVREAGIDLVRTGGDSWEDLETLAEDGVGAFTVVREGPAPAEELAPGSPAVQRCGAWHKTGRQAWFLLHSRLNRGDRPPATPLVDS